MQSLCDFPVRQANFGLAVHPHIVTHNTSQTITLLPVVTMMVAGDIGNT